MKSLKKVLTRYSFTTVMLGMMSCFCANALADTISTAVGAGADVEMREQSNRGFNTVAMNTRTSINGDRNEIIGLRFDVSAYTLANLTNVFLHVTSFRNDSSKRVVDLYGVAQGTMGGSGSFTTEDWDETALTAFGDLPGLLVTDSNYLTRSINLGCVTRLGQITVTNAAEGDVQVFSDPALTTFIRGYWGSGRVTFLLAAGSTNTDGQFRIASKEATNLATAGLFTGPAGTFAPGLIFTDTWRRRNPTELPAGNNQGITFGNGTFVVVGTNVLTSTNGASWTSHSLGGSYSLAGVVYGSGKFVAVGYGGAVLTSPDGAWWTGQSSGTSASLADVTYGNGLFVAVGSGGTILTSTNGTNWVWADSGTTTNLLGVTYGNGTFVAVGYEAIILTSDNALTWTMPVAAPSRMTGDVRPNDTGGHYSELTGVTYGDGRFVAVGAYHIEGDVGWIRYAIRACSTNNGVEWNFQQGGYGTSLSGVTYGKGIFTAVGNTGYTSTDGVSWTGSGAQGNAVGFGNGLFVAVGDNYILTSSDATVWTSAGSVTSQRLCSVTYGDTNYVAVGFGGTVLTSSNGVAWKSQTSGTSTGLYSVAYGNGTFAAVGQAILSSTNAINWTIRDSGPNYDYEAVACVNGEFMAVGANGAMKVSSDGITWSPRDSGTAATLYGVAYGNGTYVVVGAAGKVRTSADGLAWTNRTSGTTYDLNGVTYGGGVFVAQGLYGVILTSTNGLDWTSRTSGTSQHLVTSAYGFGRFIAVGLNGVILASTNAVNWVTKSSGTTSLLIGIAAGPDSFVAVGDGGWILQSGSFPPISITEQPQSQALDAGQTAQFSVKACWGAPPPSFQWLKNDAALLEVGNISGAITPLLTVSNVLGGDAGGYSVVISNAQGCATSQVATLTVIDPVITGQPVSQQKNMGESVTFSVTAAGTALNYQWRKNEVDLSDGGNVWGAHTSTLTLTNLQESDAANYTAVVSNQYGCLTSSVALLKVIPRTPPTILVNDGNFGFRTNQFGFNVGGVAGQTVVIEASTNLLDWIALTTNLLGASPLYFSDPDSTNFPARFYRAWVQ